MKVDIEGMIEIDLSDVAERIIDHGLEELAEHIDCGEVAHHIDHEEVAEKMDLYDLVDYVDMESLAESITIDQQELYHYFSQNLDYSLLAESIVARMSSDNLLTLIDELSAAHATKSKSKPLHIGDFFDEGEEQ